MPDHGQRRRIPERTGRLQQVGKRTCRPAAPGLKNSVHVLLHHVVPLRLGEEVCEFLRLHVIE
jgi:hypothetical protein